MTVTTCHIDITHDAALMKKVGENWFCSDESRSAPVGFPITNKGYWTVALPAWCERNHVPVEQVAKFPFELRAKLKKQQILEFIAWLYDDDRSYMDPEHMLTWKGEAYLAVKLLHFKAFVAQNLNARRWYYVVATEQPD